MRKECVSVPLIFILEHPQNKYFLLEPQKVKDIVQKIVHDDKSESDVIKSLRKDYSLEYLYHMCTECITLFTIQKIKNSCKVSVTIYSL